MMGAVLFTLLTSIAGATVIGSVLKRKIELSSHCHAKVFKLQRDLSRPLTKLLKMNRSAEALRSRRTAAQVRLAAAVATGNPAAIGTARAQLMVITQRQLALQAKQRLLLMEAAALRSQFKATAARLIDLAAFTHFPVESTSLAVTAVPLTSLSPSYFPSQNFYEAQGQSYRLENTYRLKLLGFQNIFKGLSVLRLSEECSATLNPTGGQQWEPAIKKVKVSWRS